MDKYQAQQLAPETPVEIRYVGQGTGIVRHGTVLGVYLDGSAINIHLTAAPWGTMMGVPSDIVHLHQENQENQEEEETTDAQEN